MTKRIFLFIIAVCFISLNISAQQSNLKFTNNNSNLGKIEDNKLPATVSFVYTNKSSEEIKIIDVKMSTNCSVSNWNKNKSILPGKGGALVFTYNVKQLGIIKEKIIVTTNEKVNNEIALSFNGEIVPRKRTHADMFTNTLGKLSFSTKVLDMGQILNTKKKIDTLYVVNNSKKPITIETSYLNPEYMTLECSPAELQPTKEGFVVVKYDAALRHDYGTVIDTIILQTNDGLDTLKKLNVKVEIIEDFSKIKPDKRKYSPKAYLGNTNYNFPLVKSGTAVKQTFSISNRGKTELVIRKVESSCECIEVTYPDKIRFSKEGAFNMVMNTSKKKGSIHETISIITNDPDNPKIVMTITGLVD